MTANNLRSFATAAAVAALAAAPVRTQRRAELWLPTTVGTELHYATSYGDLSLRVWRVERNADLTRVHYGEVTNEGTVAYYTSLAESTDGVYSLLLNGNQYANPSPLALPLGRDPVRGWRDRTMLSDGEYTVHSEWFGPEELRLPAQRLQSRRVVHVIRHAGEYRMRAVWYAPGLGMVKQRAGWWSNVGYSELKGYMLADPVDR